MIGRGVNYWISWADLTFMLFIAGLATVAISEEHRGDAERQLDAARVEIARMRRTMNPCANAESFLNGFSACVARTTGRRQAQRSGCFVTVGEDVIRFANGKAVPIDPASADSVAGCLYNNALQFAAADPGAFDAITINVDGHTDCVGDASDNQALGADRALSVYSRVLARAEDDRSWTTADAKRGFLSRIAVRSFGETRPVERSRCTTATGWADDRRVVVSVQLATERARDGRS
ncbi:MAG TPA: OmpA family protein [Thermoanaerobaculia bacterium]|nr:OmpA family protein [Thermoanaerobaculia bacterium]